MEWTKPGERPRSCDLGWKQVDEMVMDAVERRIQWLREAVERRDWYCVERLSKSLQQEDAMRAFDAIDLQNFRSTPI